VSFHVRICRVRGLVVDGREIVAKLDGIRGVNIMLI